MNRRVGKPIILVASAIFFAGMLGHLLGWVSKPMAFAAIGLYACMIFPTFILMWIYDTNHPRDEEELLALKEKLRARIAENSRR